MATPTNDSYSVPSGRGLSAGRFGMPAWRAAMVDTNKVYRVGTAVPNDANAAISWPGGVEATHFSQGAYTPGGGTRLWGNEVITGYASASLIEDDGAYGSLVFGTGGHDVLMNQVLRLNLSLGSPTFDWWQQPTYQTSDTGGADMYYDRTTWLALASTRKFETGGAGQSAATIGWAADNYPCGLDGWIFPRRMVSGGMGNNVPQGFRYNQVCYVPLSLSGLGAGAWFVVPWGLEGPFNLGIRPADVSDADWFNASAIFSPSGRRKRAMYYRNCSTGAWAQHATPFPDVPVYVSGSSTGSFAATSVDHERIYVSFDKGGGTAAWFYIDCSSGLASSTVSSTVEPATDISAYRFNCGALTDGNPHGRLLWYWLDLIDAVSGRAKRIVYQDLDNGTQARVSSSVAIDIPMSDRTAMAYRASDHSILLVYEDGAGVLKYTKVSLPADPTNTAGYSVSTSTLTFDSGVSVQSLTTLHGKYFIPSLGAFILPQGSHSPLAVRPA
jgi:hypothetical protein